MKRAIVYIAFLFALSISGNLKAFDDNTAKSFMGLYEVKQGVLAHDRGWFGVNREGFGPDYNFELMFNSPRFLKKIGSPKTVFNRPGLIIQLVLTFDLKAPTIPIGTIVALVALAK